MHLPDLKHTVLMSPADSKLVDGIKRIGVNVIYSQRISTLRDNEQYHADMQLLVIDDIAFIPNNCKNLRERILIYFDDVIICSELNGVYPNNVSLNAALIGRKLFCKASTLDPKVREICINKNIEIINVNQGYAKCSTLVVNDNAIITADKTIYNSALNNGIRALLINPGGIRLKDANYGFIGGSSGKIGDIIIFFGDINSHPDAERITEFLHEEKAEFICVSRDTLNDVGGLVQLI